MDVLDQEIDEKLNTAADDHERIKVLREWSLALEGDNLHGALQLLKEVIRLAEKHLPEDKVYLPELADCLHRYGYLCDQLADYGNALISYNRALELYKTLDDQYNVATEESHIGVIFGRLGDHSTSIQYLLAALRIFEDLEDISRQAIILNNLGFTHVLINQFDKALFYLEKGLKLAREANDAYAKAITLDSLCHAHRGLKEYDEALSYGLESVQVCRELGAKRPESEYLLSVGVVYMNKADIPNAQHYFEQCLHLAQKFGFRREQADALRRLAKIYFLQDQKERAFSYLHQALKISEEIEARHEIFKCHQDLSQAYKEVYNFEQALTHFEKFHKIKEEVFNDQADLRFKSLEAAHRVEQAQKQAEIYQLRNQALQSEIEERKVAQAQAEHIATIDGLTGQFNRRHFFQMAEKLFAQAIFGTTPLCVIMFDLDHFKEVNDTYGHLIGDQVLIAAANAIRQGLRNDDVLGRYGGEEFAVILPETTQTQGHLVAERIRQSIENTPILTGKGLISITISGGVSKIFPDDSVNSLTINLLLDRADQALYKAKQSGRNCTMVFQE